MYIFNSSLHYLHEYPLWPCLRARTQLLLPHVQFRLIITATWIELVQNNFIIIPKIHNFPHGRLFIIFFTEDFESNKALSDEIIGQSPCGTLCILGYKICRHRLYTGCKGCRICGVFGFRHKRRTNTFIVYGERAKLFNLLMSDAVVISVFLALFHKSM